MAAASTQLVRHADGALLEALDPDESLLDPDALLKTARKFPDSELCYEKELGSGPFGFVHKVLHSPGGIFAAKVLKDAHAAQDSASADELQREAALLASLRDPHVFNFLGTSINSKNQLVLITEYMEDGGLNTWLYDRHSYYFTVYQKLRITTDIAAGLAFLHGANVVHGALKSDNVFLYAGATRAKVADFGFVKLRNSSPGTSDAMYMVWRTCVSYLVSIFIALCM